MKNNDRNNELTITILKEIETWFDKNLNNKRIWTTQIGKLIKNKLSQRGNFKYSPRGNPQKGMEKSNINKLNNEQNKQLAAPKCEPSKPKEKTRTEWLILHINYLTDINNKIKEFKRNHYQSRDGAVWFNNRTHKQTDPPGAPIDNLDEYIKWETEDVF